MEIALRSLQRAPRMRIFCYVPFLEDPRSPSSMVHDFDNVNRVCALAITPRLPAGDAASFLRRNVRPDCWRQVTATTQATWEAALEYACVPRKGEYAIAESLLGTSLGCVKLAILGERGHRYLFCDRTY
eukprot:6186264-Pleurochrysis_carterae.AAC.1